MRASDILSRLYLLALFTFVFFRAMREPLLP